MMINIIPGFSDTKTDAMVGDCIRNLLAGVPCSEHELPDEPAILSKKSGENQDNLFVFDLGNIPRKNHKAGNVNFPQGNLLFLNPVKSKYSTIILKYDGTSGAVSSIISFFRIFKKTAELAANTILISPSAYRRSQIEAEKNLVKKLTGKVKGLGFINLPLFSTPNFLDHAIKSNADLLVLPWNDLEDLIPYIISNPEKKGSFPSVFISPEADASFDDDNHQNS